MLVAATCKWLQPLLVRAAWYPNRKQKLQAVNELPSMPCVKGTYKLVAFVRALLRSLLLSWSQHHVLPPSLISTPHSPSLILCSLLLFNFLYLPASCSSSSMVGATLSGFGSERHTLPARFMFRISRLMGTKEINWWFKPNETSVKLTGLINRNK